MTGEYLATALRAADLNALADKTAQPLITGETVKRLKVPQPELEAQRAIAATIHTRRTQRNRFVERLERQLELLAEHRQALITAAITGELQVSEVST